MNRLSFTLIASIWFSFAIGCSSKTSGPSGAPPIAPESGLASSPTGSISPEIDGAPKAAGYWSQAQVATYLNEELKLMELSITRADGENYSGTGVGRDGKKYQLDVKQVPGGIACEFKTETGSGKVTFGNPVP